MDTAEFLTSPLVSCRRLDSGDRAARLMGQSDCPVLPVVDDSGHMEGLVTDRDLYLGAFAERKQLSEIAVEQFMSTGADCCRAGDAIEVALELMARQRLRHVPVVDDEDRLVGVLFMEKILRHVTQLSDGARKQRIEAILIEALAAACEHPGAPGMAAASRACQAPPARELQDALRERATAQLAQSTADLGSGARGSLMGLLHELQLHRIELEMQNEELQGLQLQLAEERDRYRDLYEFAPVAYLTVDDRHVVQGANHTAHSMFGVGAEDFTGHSLAHFVDRDDTDACYLHLRKVRSSGVGACELKLRRGDGTTFHGRLDTTPLARAQGPDWYRVSIGDITASKLAEAERK